MQSVKLNNYSILRRCAHLTFLAIFIYDYCSAYEVTLVKRAQWKSEASFGIGF